MNRLKTLTLLTIGLLTFSAITTGENATKRHSQEIERTRRIGRFIEKQFRNAPARPDYPIQSHYKLPALLPKAFNYSVSNDTTPPTTPDSLVISTESIHSFFVSWNASVDPESGIEYYAYALGTEPGAADIRWWQSVGTQTQTYSSSLQELGIEEGTKFYVSVRANNAVGLESGIAVSDSIKLMWEPLGEPNNELAVLFADNGFDSTGVNITQGWRQGEIDTIGHFIEKIVPIIKEIYGPPSHSYAVKLVKNLWYVGSNIFFPSSNEIHMSDFYPQLLTHELIHAFHDNVIFSTDENWAYHPKLSGFEEAFAQGVSYICMNRYIELYPNDFIVDQTYLFGSSMDWDYDFRNVPAITTEDFWSDYGGMGLFWERYELGAAAVRKIHLEDPYFFHKFNQAYYARLNSNHDMTTSRDLMLEIISDVISKIEGKTAADWIADQRIFDCRFEPGRKIWVRTQHYPWDEFIIFQRVYYYETFENGSDWAYWDTGLESWVYYSFNGSIGTGSVSIANDSLIWQGSLQITPTSNPPDYFGYGNQIRNFSTDNDLAPWPNGDPGEFLLNMNELGLHQFDIQFDSTKFTAFRVIGDSLRSTRGVFGGIRNAKDGFVYLNHENFADESPLIVRNGAFCGQRHWASVPNQLTGGTDTQPGCIAVKFVQEDGKIYVTRRNIDWGSWNGNQAFLFDTQNMTLDTTLVAVSSNPPVPQKFKVWSNYPNPFNPATEITYRLPAAARVEVNIFNLRGQKVKQLLAKKQEPGVHRLVWDATDFNGRPVSSGTYLYCVQAGEKRFVGKALLLK